MGIKVIFGLQPEHIKIIEERISYWNKPMVLQGEVFNPTMQYSKALWEDCGKRVGWEPFTLALKYFEHINKSTPKN